MKNLFSIIMLVAVLCLVSTLLLFIYPNLTPDQANNSEPQTVQNISQINGAHSNSVKPEVSLETAKPTITESPPAETDTRQSSAVNVKAIDYLEPLEGSLVKRLEEQVYSLADDETKLRLLLSIAQCLEFISHAQNYKLNIPEPENTDELTASKLKNIQNCQFLPTQALLDLNQNAGELALNATRPEIKIQAALLLSHLPGIRQSNQAAAKNPYSHYQKQLMWLEYARSLGSLDALLNLAMRYQYGEVPDPVTASSYYFALDELAPDIEFSGQIKDYTQNLKTWQLDQAKQNGQLYIEEMRSLDHLYSW